MCDTQRGVSRGQTESNIGIIIRYLVPPLFHAWAKFMEMSRVDSSELLTALCLVGGN